MELKLIVIRSKDPEKLAAFYSLLGLTFDRHQHGNSPQHHVTTIGNTLLEIYPLAKNQADADKNLRLGFVLDDFEDRLNLLKSKNVTHTEPKQTEFGIISLITDPDGRNIELYKSK